MNQNILKSIALEYFDRLLNKKDLSVCDELLSVDYIDHDVPENTPPGPRDTKEFVTKFLDKYPNMSIKVEDIIVEDKKVVLRNVWNGNHKETGERFYRMGIVILLFNGKNQIKERWSAYKDL